MSVIGEWSLDDERINELEKEVRSLERKVKRRDNKIIELEKEIKRLKKLEKTDIEIIHAALPDLFKKTDTRYKGSSREMNHEDMGG